MRLLISTTDLDDLERVVKRLVCAYIPCEVCKEPDSARLNVWVQQDVDFPLALRILVNRGVRSRLPHWARALESVLPAPRPSAAPATDGGAPPQGPLVQFSEPTRTGTGGVTPRRSAGQQTSKAKRAFWPLPRAATVRARTADNAGVA
jgi:hypothetical protein